MISLKILELNRFMAKLLKSELFDNFLLREGFVRTYMEYRFQGKLYTDYFETEEQERYQNREYVLWGEVKPFFLELIKGKRTPLAIQLHLIFPEEEAAKLLSQAQVPLLEERPTLSLQRRFENGTARIFTGVSRSTFSLDRSVEEAWDAGVKELLHKMEIPVEQE